MLAIFGPKVLNNLADGTMAPVVYVHYRFIADIQGSFAAQEHFNIRLDFLDGQFRLQ